MRNWKLANKKNTSQCYLSQLVCDNSFDTFNFNHLEPNFAFAIDFEFTFCPNTFICVVWLNHSLCRRLVYTSGALLITSLVSRGTQPLLTRTTNSGLSLLNKSVYYKIHILHHHFDFCCSFSSGFLFMLGQPLKYPLLEHIWKLDFYLKWNKFKSLQLSTEQENQKTAKDISSLIWKLNPVLIELLIKSKLRSIDSYDIV